MTYNLLNIIVYNVRMFLLSQPIREFDKKIAFCVMSSLFSVFTTIDFKIKKFDAS